jgi:hypothetical protein
MKKIPKNSLKKLRTKDFLLTIFALLFLFLGVPGYVSLLNNWNNNILTNEGLTSLKEEDYTNITLNDGNDHRVIEWNSAPNYFDASILWNETGKHNAVISHEAIFQIILPWNITQMIEDDTTSINIIINTTSTSSMNWELGFFPIVSGEINPTDTGSPYWIKNSLMDENIDPFNGNLSVWFNTTVLDLMVIKAETGEARLILGVYYTEVGDIISFETKYEKPPSQNIDQNKALKWGGAVGGIIFILIGIGSTALWNPLDSKNPGWIDIQIKKLLNRRKK